MSRVLKNQIQKDLERRFEKLEGYILVDFRGLDSAQAYDLRKSLRTAGVRMNVVPNRLALRVLDRWEGKKPEFRELFRGPTALVFGEDGPITASRVVAQWKNQWKKRNKDLLPIKGGVLGGQVIPPAAVESLAKIPDRKQLLAQLAGTVQAPLSRLAGATQEILGRLVRVLEAYRKKLEESSPAAPAAAPPGGAAEAAPAGAAPEAAPEGEAPAAAAAPPEPEAKP